MWSLFESYWRWHPLCGIQCPRGFGLFSAHISGAYVPGASRTLKNGCFQDPREDRYFSFNSLPKQLSSEREKKQIQLQKVGPQDLISSKILIHSKYVYHKHEVVSKIELF